MIKAKKTYVFSTVLESKCDVVVLLVSCCQSNQLKTAQTYSVLFDFLINTSMIYLSCDCCLDSHEYFML